MHFRSSKIHFIWLKCLIAFYITIKKVHQTTEAVDDNFSSNFSLNQFSFHLAFQKVEIERYWVFSWWKKKTKEYHIRKRIWKMSTYTFLLTTSGSFFRKISLSLGATSGQTWTSLAKHRKRDWALLYAACTSAMSITSLPSSSSKVPRSLADERIAS